MNENSFFEALEIQYSKQLPFVVYSRPIDAIIKCWLQNDDVLHTTKTFTESGFVFAPFDFKQKSILFPESQCEYHKLDVDHLHIDDQRNDFQGDETQKTEHIQLVLKGIEAIKNNRLKKVVLSRCETKVIQHKNPIDIFKRLYADYKNAMVYCWYHPKVGLWLGATPELLFKVEGKQLTTISLAGTKAYNETLEVSWTNKETEEQQIVTEYITNQIEPYTSEIKSSEVETARAGNLLHLKTRITSYMGATSDLKSIIDALHPTPAVCGFPMTEAKEFIFQNENYNRDYYTGFLGELNLKQVKTRNQNKRNVENDAYSAVKKCSNFYVNLRCIQLKEYTAQIYVGGGVTKDSIPENEWEETVNKTKTMGKVLL